MSVDFGALRSQVIGHLGIILGDYKLPNGATVKAIAVDGGTPSSTFPPAGTQVEGIEVAISPNTEASVSPLAKGRLWDYSFEITLRQWSGDDTLFDRALEKLVEILGNQVSLGPRVNPQLGLDIVRAQKITVTQTFVKRL